MPKEDRHSKKRQALVESILQKPAVSAPQMRQDAFEAKSSDPALQKYLAKVRDHAYQVTDEEMAELQKRYDEDTLFELTGAAALGAAMKRLEKGLAVLEQAEE